MRALGPVNPDALTEWEARMQPVARRYRERRARFLLFLFGGIALFFLGVFLPPPHFGRTLSIGLLFIAAGLVMAFTIPALRCPHCEHDLERLARYCPRCSADAIQLRPLLGNRCGGCGKGLGTRRGRSFPVCFCSRCGVLVDRIGL